MQDYLLMLPGEMPDRTLYQMKLPTTNARMGFLRPIFESDWQWHAKLMRLVRKQGCRYSGSISSEDRGEKGPMEGEILGEKLLMSTCNKTKRERWIV